MQDIKFTNTLLLINFALFSSSTSLYILFLNHVLPVLHICIVGSSFGWSHYLAFGFLRRSTSRTTRFMTSSLTSWSDLSAFTSTRRSLHRRPVGWATWYLILHQPTSWTARFMDFITDQLVRLFGVHFYSVLTSLPTSWLGCSVLDCSPTN